jgi:hypothetical protein
MIEKQDEGYLWELTRTTWLRENITAELMRKLFTFNTPEEADEHIKALIINPHRKLH